MGLFSTNNKSDKLDPVTDQRNSTAPLPNQNHPHLDTPTSNPVEKNGKRKRSSWVHLPPVYPRISSLLFLLLAIVLIPVLVVQAFIYVDRFQNRRDTEYAANLEFARSVAVSFDSFVRDVVHQQAAISAFIVTEPVPSSEQINVFLARSARNYSALKEISVTDLDGRITESSNPALVGLDASDRQYLAEIRAGKEWAANDLVISRADGQPTFLIGYGIRGDDGQLRGFVTASINPKKLGSEAIAVERVNKGVIVLLDRNGYAVYRYPEFDYTWEQRDFIKANPKIADAIAGKEVTGTFISIVDGQTRLASYVPISSIGWVISSNRPESDVLGPIQNDFYRDFGILLTVSLLALALAIVIIQSIVRPLSSLREQAIALGGGKMVEWGEAQRLIELRDLEDSFKQMNAEIKQRVQQVELANSRLGSLMALAQGLADQVEYRQVGRIALEGALGLLGGEKAALYVLNGAPNVLRLVAFRELDRMLIGPESEVAPERVNIPTTILIDDPSLIARAARAGEIIVEGEGNECGYGEGSFALATPLYSGSKLIGVLCLCSPLKMIARDGALGVGDRNTVETIAHMTAVALERARLVSDLRASLRVREEFLNLAAHELKTPLTAFKAAAQVLSRRGGHNSEEQRLFDVITAQATKLTHLILEIESAVQIQTGDLHLRIEPIDLGKLASDLTRHFGQRSSHHVLRFEGPKRLRVQGDTKLLREIIESLLDNAIKFSPSGGEITVRLSVGSGRDFDSSGASRSVEGSKQAILEVIDQGIGISEDQQRSLFEMFYQVAPMIMPTSGMGLSLYICREIIKQHGGQIWVESKLDLGSVFGISLPLFAPEPTDDPE